MTNRMANGRQVSQKPLSCQECRYRGSQMFCNLSRAALEEFGSLGCQLTLPRGATLFHEGDPALHVTIICDGQVKLSCTSREGKTLILRIATAGDVLGLSPVLSHSENEVTAEALETCLVKTVPCGDFVRFLEKHAQAGMHAAQALSGEYRTAFSDARRLALAGSVRARLASVLLDWGHGACRGKAEMRFHMTLTHEELASLAGTTRESVTRTLGRLQQEGLIQVRGAAIHIPDPGVLAEVAQ